MNMIELREVSKRYGTMQALAPVDLTVREGEFVTLLGPSGSGKTTLLSLIAGMIPPSTGRIFIQGKDVTESPPSQRQLGMVFQNYALMPHMTVFENIAFPLRVRRLPKDVIKQKVHDVLKLVRLPDVAKRKPRELSGGQQQRVSLARCIVYNPALILLDEPLGALDKKLREQMQLELRRVHDELGITMLNVTHDQDEALTMSDRIVLMNNGRIEQQDAPENLYFRPVSRFAADFIGTANLISCQIESQPATDDMLTVSTPFGRLQAPRPVQNIATGAQATLLLRPESVRLLCADEPDDIDTDGVNGVLDSTLVLGSVVRHHVVVSDSLHMVVQEQNHRNRVPLARQSPVRLRWARKDCLILD